MKKALSFLILLCSTYVVAADVYINGVKVQNIDRIDITVAVPPVELPRVQPGNEPNWQAATTIEVVHRPDLVGNEELPIARWHVPCYETYDTNKVIGLLAFHVSGIENGDEGIERVELAANNGEVATITEPTKHPTLGYWGWWAELLPTEFDSIVEVRAKVYPHAGIPRILNGGYVTSVGRNTILPTTEQSLLLWSNAGGTYTREPIYVGNMEATEDAIKGSRENPFSTIQEAFESVQSCDHLTIYLLAGKYVTPRMSEARNGAGWLTIEADPETPRHEVILTGGNSDLSSNNLMLVRLKDLTIQLEPESIALFRSRSTSYKMHFWFDGCDVNGISREVSSGGHIITGSSNLYYMTRSETYRGTWNNFNSGPFWRQLVYGVDCNKIAGDIFTGNAFTRDFNVTDHVQLPGQHTDLWQGYGGPPNRILCDGKIDGFGGQVFFFDDGIEKNTNIAMVNVACDYTGSVGASQFGQGMRHVLLWHNNNDQRLLHKDSEDLSIHQAFSGRGNIFSSFSHVKRTRTLEEIVAAGGFYWTDNYFSSTKFPPEVGGFTGENIPDVARTVRWDANQNLREERTFIGPY